MSASIGYWIAKQDDYDAFYGRSLLFQSFESIDGYMEPSSVPPQILIDHAIERSNNREPLFILSPSDSQIAKRHPAFENMTEPFKPRSEWKRSHFPSINILGLPKAGTSHLYQILTTHAQINRFNKRKEFYFNLKPTEMSKIHQISYLPSDSSEERMEYIQDLMRLANEDPKGWIDPPLFDRNQTVNGGLNPRLTLLQAQYLGRTETAKYIILLRDPADWLWAGYCFWLHPEHEDAIPPLKNDWASAPMHYRSPEIFHEYMRAGERNLFTKDLLGKFRDSARTTLQLLKEATSKKNLLVLKSEDFAPHVVKESGVMQKLARFLEISEDKFDDEVVYSYGNCGDQKGVDEKCTKSSNAYTITGKRPMLEHTRDLVYLQFAEECKFWKEEFDVFYDRCLQVRDKYVGGNQHQPTSSSSTEKLLLGEIA
ncbi:sulfotransferase family protein [Nitzschia inconspicua]|uniref:Sulfotransferase family protein n=1 Tax=Nitzschia inconspicua TaxID=303405 RepID=A0A9K3LSU3_9STRA|nr:sulfotransferase family protein [Nitzschia inconspicua]